MAGTTAKLAAAALLCLVVGRAGAESPAPPAATPLLVGVIMLEGNEPMAILEDPATHGQEIYPLGAQIGSLRLTKILRDRVVLTSNGNHVEVRLAGSPPPPRSATRQPAPRPGDGRRSLSAPQTSPSAGRPTR
jgi:type II secretory pathway component PulC